MALRAGSVGPRSEAGRFTRRPLRAVGRAGLRVGRAGRAIDWAGRRVGGGSDSAGRRGRPLRGVGEAARGNVPGEEFALSRGRLPPASVLLAFPGKEPRSSLAGRGSPPSATARVRGVLPAAASGLGPAAAGPASWTAAAAPPSRPNPGPSGPGREVRASAGAGQPAQNWHGAGESDCLIKTEHCEVRNRGADAM